MGKAKTTIYVDQEVIRAARIWAARTGRRDSEVIEEALRSYLGIGLLQSIWADSDLAETEAMKLAYEELHASRK